MRIIEFNKLTQNYIGWKKLEKNKKSLKIILKTIIKSTFLVIYVIFLGGLIIGGISSGIITLIPDEASKPCYLEYYAHCSFTPFSTLILFAMTVIGTVLLIKLIKYLKRKNKRANESKPMLKALIKS
ncbi:MAG: hypothetical protein ACXACC_02780 [Promethearchaeota archaeon]|jgi:uncharacterized membrane protein YedE/YeeE